MKRKVRLVWTNNLQHKKEKGYEYISIHYVVWTNYGRIPLTQQNKSA